jgi:hypothetical protein
MKGTSPEWRVDATDLLAGLATVRSWPQAPIECGPDHRLVDLHFGGEMTEEPGYRPGSSKAHCPLKFVSRKIKTSNGPGSAAGHARLVVTRDGSGTGTCAVAWSASKSMPRTMLVAISIIRQLVVALFESEGEGIGNRQSAAGLLMLSSLDGACRMHLIVLQ